MQHYGLTPAGIELVIALCQEAGEDPRVLDRTPELLEGFTANHSAEDINAAAAGNAEALIALRQACGLPILS